MDAEEIFHWLFIAIFVATLSISGYFRHRARRSGEVVPRAREGKPILLARFLFAAPLYLSMLTYMVHPDWMTWSSIPLPSWSRWLGAVVGLGMLPMLNWVVRSLGTNISETFLTKEHHSLVTHGPYRWVRHPLYSVATIVFASLSILAANWFMMAMAFLIIIGVSLVVIPREEAELLRKFEPEYREYMERTGRFLPRLGAYDPQ
jgi:protein-S-isoprenylcysteine O-methyltransferase Ste14